MTKNNKTEMVGTDTNKQLVEHDIGLVKEVQLLRQHVKDMYRAWIAGKAPIPPPPGFSDGVLTRTLEFPNHSSISQIEEQPKEDFGKFWLKWSEQVVRDNFPMKRKDIVKPPQQQGPVVVLAKYPNALYRPCGYPCNPPNHYYPLQEPHFSVHCEHVIFALYENYSQNNSK